MLNQIVHLMYVNASDREMSNTGLKGLQLASQSIVGYELLADGWRKLRQLVRQDERLEGLQVNRPARKVILK